MCSFNNNNKISTHRSLPSLRNRTRPMHMKPHVLTPSRPPSARGDASSEFCVHHSFVFPDSLPQMDTPYFAIYNAHFFAQIFEGKIRICIICG